MRQRNAIELVDGDLLIFFPYNRENNRALREYTRATDLWFDRRLHAYRLSAVAASSPEVCHNLRGFGSRRRLRIDRAASLLLGAFITPSTRARINAEIQAIDDLFGTQLTPNPTADSEADRRAELQARRNELAAMLSWHMWARRPEDCEIASPGSLFHFRYDDGEEDTCVISAVDVDGYNRVSPFQPVGKALSTARIGARASLGKGRGSLTVLDISD